MKAWVVILLIVLAFLIGFGLYALQQSVGLSIPGFNEIPSSSGFSGGGLG